MSTFFCFNAPAASDIYTLFLHDALPISLTHSRPYAEAWDTERAAGEIRRGSGQLFDPDRKSTRLNSSHVSTSYAVFCLKKKMRRCPPTPCARSVSGC